MLMKQQQKRHMFERSELCRFGLNLHLTKPKYQPLAFLPTACFAPINGLATAKLLTSALWRKCAF